MSKIKEIIINNYKVFGGINIIELSAVKEKPLSIFVGANASGKSTIADAIQWGLGLWPYTDVISTLNIGVAARLCESDSETISVELRCETLYGIEHFKREVVVSKEVDTLVNSSEKYYKDGEELSYSQYFAITDKRFPLLDFQLFVWDEWMQLNRFPIDIENKLISKFYNEDGRIDILNLIVQDATEILHEVQPRTSMFEIKWNERFRLYRFTDILESYDDMSAEMAFMVNMCILIASVNFLEKCCACSNEFPIIIDNISISSDPRMMSINKLSEIFFPRQVLFLVNKRIYNDLDEANKHKFGKIYLIRNDSEISAELIEE